MRHRRIRSARTLAAHTLHRIAVLLEDAPEPPEPPDHRRTPRPGPAPRRTAPTPGGTTPTAPPPRPSGEPHEGPRPAAPPRPSGEPEPSPAPLPGVAADLLAVADRLTSRELARRIATVVARLPGIETIGPEPGTPFDPAVHRWEETRPTDTPDQRDRVAALLAPGFREAGTRKVLRPARVAVYDMEEEPHD